MKVLIALVFTVLCLNSYLATSQTLRGTCTLSGDPHIWMLDNVGVHFQGLGTFTVVKSLPIEVQATTRRWSAGATATRAMTMRLRSQLNARVAYDTMVGWGSWGGTNAIAAWGPYKAQAKLPFANDKIVISTPSIIPITTNTGTRAFDISLCSMVETNNMNTYTCPYTAFINKDVYINNREYKINVGTSASCPWVQVLQQGVKFPIEVRMNFWMSLMVAVPNDVRIFSQTNGLCGFWDGIPATEFIDANNTNLVTNPPVYSGRWYQTPTTEKWGNSYAVAAVNLLLPSYVASIAGVESTDASEATVADAETIDMLDKISFKSLAELNAAQEVCEKEIPTDKPEFITPCVFDLAVASAEAQNGVADANGFAAVSDMAATAFDAAMSNVRAAQFISENESANNNGVTGVFVGIAVAGAVAMFAFIAVAVLAIRVRRTMALVDIATRTASTSVTISMT